MMLRFQVGKPVQAWCLYPLLLAGLVDGCVHEQQVTTRPTYAFPQHLSSLCGKASRLAVLNRGEFVTANRTSGGNVLLLSAQLSGEDLALQRRITHLELLLSEDHGATVTAYDGERRWLLSEFAPENLRCEASGEMLLSYPDDGFYFWASVGNKQRQLALWRNNSGDLVIQNRWIEEHTGLVSGSISGDAWALFKADEPSTVGSAEPAPESTAGVAAGVSACAELSGSFLPEAEVVHADGSVSTRSAADQFFREELVGEQPLNQGTVTATELRLRRDDNSGLVVSLYDESSLLGERQLPARSLTCRDGRWSFKGEKNMHSAWLLLAASGGVYWEDLTLWRDNTGALLVEGRYTQRSLLLLIPFGGTQSLFMAFPKKGSEPF